MPRLDPRHWDAGIPFSAFVESAQVNRELWNTMFRLVRLDEATDLRAKAITTPLKLLVLVEDWCGDAINTVPLIQHIASASDAMELRVLSRDEHDDVMSAHLLGTSRSIPVVMVFDADGHHRGWWGPRPSPLQDWVKSEGLLLDKAERYKRIRTWYAHDRGRTTADEVLSLLESAALTR